MSLSRICASFPTSRAALVACALAGASLVGCYDLSTSGPTPDDFARTDDGTETQEQGQVEGHATKVADPDRSRALVEAIEPTAAADVIDQNDKTLALRNVPPAR